MKEKRMKTLGLGGLGDVGAGKQPIDFQACLATINIGVYARSKVYS